MPSDLELARELYDALAPGDGRRWLDLLHPEFVGHLADGMPHQLGGTYEGPGGDAARRMGRGARLYARPVPSGSSPARAMRWW